MNPVVISQKRVLDACQRQASEERDLGLSVRQRNYATQRVFRLLANAARVEEAKAGMELVRIESLGRKEVEVNRFPVTQLNGQRGSSVQREMRGNSGE